HHVNECSQLHRSLLERSATHTNWHTAPQIAALDLAHAPGKPAPEGLIVTDVHGHRAVLLIYLDLQNLAQARPIRWRPARSPHWFAAGRLLKHDPERVILRRQNRTHDCVRSLLDESRVQSANVLRDHDILLDTQIVT